MHTEVKSVHHIHVFARPTPRRDDHGPRIILSLRRNRRRQTRIVRKATHGTNDVNDDAKEEEESYEKFVHKITTPRVKFGTRIHRTLHHHAFSKHKSYAYQWQAFCARSERYDYRDVVSEEAETFLSTFHFKFGRRVQTIRARRENGESGEGLGRGEREPSDVRVSRDRRELESDCRSGVREALAV